jgi:hypothetical protein
MQYRNVIIGTGFAAHYVASQLPPEETLMIQPRSHHGDILEIVATTNSIFETLQVDKTKNMGGGRAIWGGAVSYPSGRNYLKKTANTKWNHVCEELLAKASKPIMDVSSSTSVIIEKIFPGVSSVLEIEPHGYITGQFGEIGEYQFPQEGNNEILEGALIDVSQINNEGFILKLISIDGSVAIIETQNLVLATGNFLNACYTSLFTNIRRFPVGNHCSKKIGELAFSEPMRLRNIAQTYEKKENRFVTIGNNGFSPNFHGVSNSIRLQVTDSISTQRALFDYLVKDFFKSRPAAKIRTIWAIFIAILRKKRLISLATVRMMTDQPADDGNNYFEITGLENGKWKTRVKLELPLPVIEDVEALIHLLNRSASQSHYLKQGTRLSLGQNLESADNVWRDAGHYYGSVPVGLPIPHQATVDENLQLHGFKNIYVVGSSSFPIGSHGHPTKLIIDLASRLGQYISEKNG